MKNNKKIPGVFSAVILLLAALGAAAGEPASVMEIVEIKERMFIQQCYDIMFNQDDYLGRTVRLEGMYLEVPSSSGETTCYVYRKTPGCCGDDGMAGFIVFPERCPIPEQNAWVEATGKVELTERKLVALRLSSLKVMDKRGAEIVGN